MSLQHVSTCAGTLKRTPAARRLNCARNPTEMMVTWVTSKPAAHQSVEYNVHGKPLSLNVTSTVTKFTDGGWEHRVLFIHRAKLTGLTPYTAYDYRCGEDHHWSDVYTFKTLRSGESWSPRIAMYGDMGTDGQSLPYLEDEAKQGNFDVILHVGDFAYNMDSDNARVADKFMNQIQPIAARVPYMTCPGNHENAYNFSNYKNRFSMPGNSKNMFYSWNVGPAHIISISTEFYFYHNYGTHQMANQFKWLEADLQEATKKSNRAVRPWIITMGHRPMYCSNADGDDCTKHESVVRTGIKSKYGLENLLYKYGVDLMVWAHEHSYERLYPVYNRKLCEGPLQESYINPCAPVHITTGSAGCEEHHDPFKKKYGPWTAFRALDYGYTRMTIHNNTHLYLEQVSVDKGGEVIDNVWIVKHLHGPEAWIKPMK
ncbi:hypothetical protein ACROYT_G041799 [Oculina patagonica]